MSPTKNGIKCKQKFKKRGENIKGITLERY